MSLASVFNQTLFNGSPYDSVDLDAYPMDLQGWCEDPEIFDHIIDTIHPTLIIEVGSWKGTSAHHMVTRAKQHQADATIICIDTWLGSDEHWRHPVWREMLNIKGGRPTLHEQFIANVVHAGLQDHIVPIPLPSRLASMVLSKISMGEKRLQADMIYIDGAHDEASVREDIASYWPLLRPGGVMLGDDCAEPWDGVIAAVADFRERHKDEIRMTENVKTRWYAQKKMD